MRKYKEKMLAKYPQLDPKRVEEMAQKMIKTQQRLANPKSECPICEVFEESVLPTISECAQDYARFKAGKITFDEFVEKCSQRYPKKIDDARSLLKRLAEEKGMIQK